MLENGNAGNRLAAFASAVPIGQQQNADGERDETQAERKPFDDVDHNDPKFVRSRCEVSEDSRALRGSKERHVEAGTTSGFSSTGCKGRLSTLRRRQS